jgi:hypothetical protein
MRRGVPDVPPHDAGRASAGVEREPSGPPDPEGDESDRHGLPPRAAAPFAAFTWESRGVAGRSHIVSYRGRSTLLDALDGVLHGQELDGAASTSR